MTKGFLPPYWQVVGAFQMFYSEVPLAQVARTLGVSRSTIYRWLDNEDKYSPYVDRTAVARALAGERPVWDRLTVWEEKRVLEALRATRGRYGADSVEWKDYVHELADKLKLPGLGERL